MKNAKVLVTGGLGYIGSHTCVQMIEQGMQPIILDNLCNANPEVLNRIETITGTKPIFYVGDVRDSAVLGLKSCIRATKYRSYKSQVGKITKNILKRKFKAKKPNYKWGTDVTQFNVQCEKLYLSPIMDLFNGEIVSYKTQRSPTYKLVDQMLKQAITKLKANEKSLIHSDQGLQYQMDHYQQQLQERGLKQSMSRKGNCLDNPSMESFFGILRAYLNRD
nr:IS3 family transposase [Providencia rettgeri]QLQ64212.1 IS3 family transposase [Providencia rettgeri]